MSDSNPVPAQGAKSESATVRPSTARLQSLDAFRGLTMFWLMGGKAFAIALAGLAGFEFIGYQLNHSEWEGVRYYDVIWPSFMLMVGVSIPFAFAKRSRTQTRGQQLRDAWWRAAILFLLGSLRESMSDGVPRLIELSSALQPIALAYIVGVYLETRTIRVLAGVAAGILAGYALLLALVGTSTIPAGTYEVNRNIVSAFDDFLIGRSHPEGWGTALSAIPTLATTLVGLIFGKVLLAGSLPGTKLKVFVLTGLGCLAAGYAMSPVVPIIMKLWTTSYGLATLGWACLLFAAFYWVIDIKGWRAWSFPLVVIGINALAAYLLNTIMPIGRLVNPFTKPLVPSLGAFGPVLATGAVFFTGWLILLWLHRRKIYLRP